MTKVSTSKIGILGGTFNPVHLGHLIVAQNAIERYELSRILFIPCANPPHKDNSSLLAATHRVAMLQAAIEDDPRFEISDVEIARRGPSYTVDTITELKTVFPDSSFYFIIGSDTLTELHLWKDIYRLLTMCTFITFNRSGSDLRTMTPETLHLDPPWPERLLKEAGALHLIDISSSEIRHRIAEGMSIRYLVTQAVESYITEHHLYRG
jgi:nicotinate-nucleotide adenylyltransferase